jgi:hypothetical protein
MNEYLKVFDTIRFYTPRSIFENFVRFFHFLNSNSNFKFGLVGNRPEPGRGRAGVGGDEGLG